MGIVSVNTNLCCFSNTICYTEPGTSSDLVTGFQINGLIATVFAAVLGALACASLVLLTAFLSVSLCCKQRQEKG